MKTWIARHLNGALTHSASPSSTTLRTAEQNEANYESLSTQLCTAHERSGYTAEQAAERLGVDVETFENALHGRRDMTMMELRLLAASIDAIVEFKVTSACDFRYSDFGLRSSVMTLVQRWDQGSGEKSWSAEEHLPVEAHK
jgi:transcriptional regulator with XRE-family HTH domain